MVFGRDHNHTHRLTGRSPIGPDQTLCDTGGKATLCLALSNVRLTTNDRQLAAREVAIPEPSSGLRLERARANEFDLRTHRTLLCSGWRLKFPPSICERWVVRRQDAFVDDPAF